MTASAVAAGSPVLLCEDRDGVVTLTLNRPEQLNALSEELLLSLQNSLEDIALDRSVRCVVLAGRGKAFCAGHDLRQMRSHEDAAYFSALFRRCSTIMQSLQALPVPVIARIHGLATAAGCQLVASCDLAIASSSAKFAVSGINVGLFCSTPAVALSRSIATKRAIDMLLTGEFIDASTAERWGLINEAVDAGELDQAVARKVSQILSKSSTSIAHGKRMFHHQKHLALGDAYQYAADVMVRNMLEEDAIKGIDAFLRRKPCL